MTTQAFDFALDSLDILSETGLTVAPRTPSVAMCEAGAKVCGLDLATAHKIYEAMLNAALDNPESRNTYF